MKCFMIENLSVKMGNSVILKDINLHIHNGEITALIGPNGAGKSTLFKALIGDIPYSGKFTYHNCLSPLNNLRIGYVPQKMELDSSSPISVRDLFSASITRIPVWLTHTRKSKLAVRKFLSMVKAEHLVEKRLGDLSGGELQRVLLALALNPLPDLLLLDEPFSAVDQGNLDGFYSLVESLVREYDFASIIVSHDLSSAAKYAGTMIFLNNSIQSVGTPEQVLADEKFCQAFPQGIRAEV